MDRIIINEIDATSNYEVVSDYDIAYVPGFAGGGNSTINADLYRIPTLVTDKYQFVSLFGSSPASFNGTQYYPNSFPDEAVYQSTYKTSFIQVEVTGFDSYVAISESPYYTEVTEIPKSADEVTFPISLYTAPKESTTTFGLTYINTYTSEDFEALKTAIEGYIPHFNYTAVEPEEGDVPSEEGWYVKDDSEEGYSLTTDTSVVSGTTYYTREAASVDATKGVFSSNTNPNTTGWFSDEEGQTVTVDTHIDPSHVYYMDESKSRVMFTEDDFDLGWQYAYSLVSMGMPVYYEQMNRTLQEVTVDMMYAGLEDRFIAPAAGEGTDDDGYYDYSFDSMGDYSVKFLTSGGYPTFEYNNNALAIGMITTASNRMDSIALIDHTNNPTRDLTTWSDTSVITKVRNGALSDAGMSSYGAMFTPWFESSAPGVTPNGDGETFMPGSFAYLTALAVQLRTSNPWLAVSGVSRGIVPYCSGLHTTRPLTNNIADSYQILPGTTISVEQSIVSINPITYIRNHGYCIWGNRTLLNNSGGTTASSFLNIRSAVSDIKKRIYEASQSLLFEQNTDITWLSFKSMVEPLLEEMITDFILNDYQITRLYVDPDTGITIPAYKVYAVIRIQPINSIEVFELTVRMENEDSSDFTINVTESE